MKIERIYLVVPDPGPSAELADVLLKTNLSGFVDWHRGVAMGGGIPRYEAFTEASEALEAARDVFEVLEERNQKEGAV